MGLPKRLGTFGCGLVLSLILNSACAEVVVVVSARTPVDALTRQQLADIYLSRRRRFPSDGPVIPIDQAEDSPAYAEFYSKYLGRSPAQIKAHWSKLIFTGRGQPPQRVPTGTAVIELVTANPNAIAYVDADLVDDRVRMVSIE